MATIAALKQRRATIRAKIKATVERAEAADEELSPELAKEVADQRAEIAALDVRITNLEDVAGDGADPGDATGGERAIVRDPERPHAPAIHTREHKYMLTRALQSAIDGKRVVGLEGEWSREMEIRSKKSARGFMVPHHFGDRKKDDAGTLARRAISGPANARALTTITGAGAIPTILDASLIDFLYARSGLGAAGATLMSDMAEQFAIPRQSATSTGYWFTEGNAPQASNAQLDQVVFVPKSFGAYTDLSRKFILQTSIDAEAFARNDLARIVALGIDAAGFTGSGVNPVPLGITNNPGVNVVSLGANSGAMTWGKVVDLESAVANANADTGRTGYVTSAKGRGALKQTLKAAGTSNGYLVAEDGTLNGSFLIATNNVPNNFSQGSSGNVLTALIYGTFEEMIVAMFGATDLIVDTSTGSTSGTVRLVTIQDADIHARHDAAFSVCLFNPNITA